jgi:hypothetical protein
MTPRKPVVKPKKTAVRHHPFERALTWAENRILKAESERKKHMEKLEALNKEIPTLREIIRVHGGKSDIGRQEYQEYTSQLPDGTPAIGRNRDRELLPDLVNPVMPAGEPDFLEETDRRLNQMRTK